VPNQKNILIAGVVAEPLMKHSCMTECVRCERES